MHVFINCFKRKFSHDDRSLNCAGLLSHFCTSFLQLNIKTVNNLGIYIFGKFFNTKDPTISKAISYQKVIQCKETMIQVCMEVLDKNMTRNYS